MAESLATVRERIETFSDTYETIAEEIELPDLQKLFLEGDTTGIKRTIERFQSAARASIPDDSPLLQVFLRCSFSLEEDDTVAPVKITLSTRPSNPVAFSATTYLSRDESWVAVYAFFQQSYEVLLEESAIHANLNELNDHFADLMSEEPISLSFFTGGKVVSSASDEDLVLSINPERIFDLDSVIAFQDTEDEDSTVDAEVVESARDEFRAAVEGVTTVGILENPPALVKYFMIPNRRSAIKLLKDAYPKTWDQVREATRGGVFHHEKDGAFTILQKDDSGIEVLVSPVDVETLEKVDVDVIPSL